MITFGHSRWLRDFTSNFTSADFWFLKHSCLWRSGLNAVSDYIDDFWAGGLQLNDDQTDLLGISWTLAEIRSPNRPPVRAYSSATELFGSLFIFGGLGQTLVTKDLILGDFWKYDPNGKYWAQIPVVASSGDGPVARYGHTLTSMGRIIYLFGGITSTGQTDELWSCDVSSAVFVEVLFSRVSCAPLMLQIHCSFRAIGPTILNMP